MSLLIATSFPNFAFIGGERKVTELWRSGIGTVTERFAEGPRKTYKVGDGFVGLAGDVKLCTELAWQILCANECSLVPSICCRVIADNGWKYPGLEKSMCALVRPGELWYCRLENGECRPSAGNPFGGYVFGWPGDVDDAQRGGHRGRVQQRLL